MQSKVETIDLVWRGLLSAALWLAADAAAMVLWMENPAWVGASFGRMMQIFELQSFTHVLALLAIGWLFLPVIRKRSELRWPIAVFFLWALFYQTLFQTFGRPSYDYLAWAHGMQSQVQFGNPYMGTDSPIYWYPPALAQMLASWHVALDAIFPATVAFKGSHGQTLYHLVYYVFQSSQEGLLLVTFWLVYAYCRDLRIPIPTASMMAGVLLLLNVPLYRMLIFQQANLWLVNAFLMVLLFRDRSPLLTGMAIAWGFHMKLYPAILGLPLLLAGYWRCLLWSGFFALLVFGFQIGWGSNLEVWIRFLVRMSDPMIGSFYRDNSLHGIAKNLLKPFDLVQYTGWLTGFFQVVAVGWIGSRVFRREQLYYRTRRTSGPSPWLASFRFNEQFMDTVALGLMLSPLVFEHHYAMAIPLVVWTLLTRSDAAPYRILTGSIMMLLIPIYDVCPLSWNRIAGLLILMSARPIVFPSEWPSWPPAVFKRWFPSSGEAFN